MAITPEQQADIDFQIKLQEATDTPRRLHEIAMEKQRARLDAVRLAKETLLENSRSKPADERNVTAADITAFAETLNTYINQ